MLGCTRKIKYEVVESFCAVAMLVSSAAAIMNNPTMPTKSKRALLTFTDCFADFISEKALVASEPAAKLKKGRDW